MRAGCPCLLIDEPQATAKRRIRDNYEELCRRFEGGERLLKLTKRGELREDPGRKKHLPFWRLAEPAKVQRRG